MTVMSRADLVEHLVRTRIAGDVATPRQGNLGNIRKMLDRHPDYWFGLELDHDWTYEEVAAVLVERIGIDPDLSRESGADRIDPALCVAALDDARERLRGAAADRARVLFATGHPTGLLAMLLPMVQRLEAEGCEIVTPAAEEWVRVGELSRRIRYIGGVATLGTGGDVLHTHAPEPMQRMLSAARGEPVADLVIADHGWAGAAGQAGLAVIGFADTNDPALFVGAAEGKVEVVVPLDDNVAPAGYAPLASYLLSGLDEVRRSA
ncbi:MAG: phosphatase [Frankiales bacterium]|nr:phosphatase [Frankiales bacterium]